MRKLFLLSTFLLFLATAFPQANDAIKISEARLAIEKYKDCKAALDALREVSNNGKQNPLFLLYAGKTFDCLNRFDSAIYYYTKYVDAYPNATDIIQRIAELNYEKRKEKNRYKLSGNWYAEGEPGTIRRISQYGDQVVIRTKDDGSDRRDRGTLFDGTLQPTGVYKGGTTFYVDEEDVKKSFPSDETPCKRYRYKNENGDIVYFEDSYNDSTDGDILKVSEDGNKIFLTRTYLARIAFDGCLIRFIWEKKTIIYIRIVN